MDYEYNAGTFATDRSKVFLDHSYCSSLNIAGSFVGLLCLARLNITPWGSSSFVFGYIGTWSFVESFIIMDTGLRRFHFDLVDGISYLFYVLL